MFHNESHAGATLNHPLLGNKSFSINKINRPNRLIINVELGALKRICSQCFKSVRLRTIIGRPRGHAKFNGIISTPEMQRNKTFYGNSHQTFHKIPFVRFHAELQWNERNNRDPDFQCSYKTPYCAAQRKTFAVAFPLASKLENRRKRLQLGHGVDSSSAAKTDLSSPKS